MATDQLDRVLFDDEHLDQLLRTPASHTPSTEQLTMMTSLLDVLKLHVRDQVVQEFAKIMQSSVCPCPQCANR
jgi:hypothetical protein